MSKFNYQTFKKLEPIIEEFSKNIGPPPVLEKAIINLHSKDVLNELIKNDKTKSYEQNELSIYVKKYVGSKYRIPKKKKVKKVKSKPKPVIKKDTKNSHKFNFNTLPHPNFKMDHWKVLYSNDKSIPFGTQCMEEFWNNVDKTNTSVWHGSYKYNNENQLIFIYSKHRNRIKNPRRYRRKLTLN